MDRFPTTAVSRPGRYSRSVPRRERWEGVTLPQGVPSLPTCPARIGCSMECKSISASRFSLSIASEGRKAPLASTRSSISLAEKCARMCFNKESSRSKFDSADLQLDAAKALLHLFLYLFQHCTYNRPSRSVR